MTCGAGAVLRPSNLRLLLVLPVLLAAAIGLQMARDRSIRSASPTDNLLWFRSGEAVKRMALGYDALVADVYWMRAVIYYGGQRLLKGTPPNYDVLYSLLDLVTTLDPRFNLAYRFGAIFLAESYPNGPGRPDQAIALLQRGIERTGRWEYMHDIGLVHYWYFQDYPEAAKWFERAAQEPSAPPWLEPLAATTLAAGGDRQSSRLLWQQMLEAGDAEWLRTNAEYRLRQLDAMDTIDALNAAASRYAALNGRPPGSWEALATVAGLGGIPVDSSGTPFLIDSTTGLVTIAPDSPLAPLPTELPQLPADAPRPPS